eukprot:TRINITY_DN354_c0_g1_i1.p1 TRINITY_DN354_c0_g1~~TRINITY_DN354_c0_g1_i1.p1  ORF type:complete len:249 (-),score=69.09 TRINITY_DN354_c0_g1_i1:50-796(-)
MVESSSLAHVIDVPSLDSIVHALSRRENFFKLLDLIVQDQHNLESVVQDSYHHDLFDKTVLMSGKKSSWKLRLHVFTPDTFTLAQEEIHSHRNHFVSTVLHGGFTQQLWEDPKYLPVPPELASTHDPNPTISSFYKYIYDPTVTDDGTRMFNIVPQGKIDLACVATVTIPKGTTYYMHPSVLHSVNSLDGCTITLVLNSPQATTKSCFSSEQPWEDESFVRARFTPEEMVKQLNFVRSLLENNQQQQQ